MSHQASAAFSALWICRQFVFVFEALLLMLATLPRCHATVRPLEIRGISTL